MPPPSSLNPLSFVATCWRHRVMIFRLVARRIEEQYRGSVLGMAWVVLEPVAMLFVYTFVFSFVFSARWGALPADRGHFALYLFSGLTIYAVFSETVNESPRAILSAEAYVKQLVFPAEVLAWVALLTSLFKFAISWLVLLVWYGVSLGTPPATALLVPIVLLPVIFVTLGATWFLSALGVYLRDLGKLVGLFTTALLFLSPIFYPASVIPEQYRDLYFLNPFAGVLEISKQSLFEGVVPPFGEIAVLFAAGWLVAWVGHAWFMRTKAGFADVL